MSVLVVAARHTTSSSMTISTSASTHGFRVFSLLVLPAAVLLLPLVFTKKGHCSTSTTVVPKRLKLGKKH